MNDTAGQLQRLIGVLRVKHAQLQHLADGMGTLAQLLFQHIGKFVDACPYAHPIGRFAQ